MFGRVSIAVLFRGLTILAGVTIVLTLVVAAYLHPQAPGGTSHSRPGDAQVAQVQANDTPMVTAQGASRLGEATARVGQQHARLLRALVEAPSSEGVDITSVMVTITGDGQRWGIPALQLWRDVREDGSVDEEHDLLLAEVPGDQVMQPGGQSYTLTRSFVSARGEPLTTLGAGERCELVVAVSRVGDIESDSRPEPREAGDGTEVSRVPGAVGLVVGLCLAVSAGLPRRPRVVLLLGLALASGLLAMTACGMSAPPRSRGSDPTIQVILTGVAMRGAETGRDWTQSALRVEGPVVTIAR